VLVKLYVTPTADDTLGHVKLIDVAFDETVVQDPVSVGAETNRSVQCQTTAFKIVTATCNTFVYTEAAPHSGQQCHLTTNLNSWTAKTSEMTSKHPVIILALAEKRRMHENYTANVISNLSSLRTLRHASCQSFTVLGMLATDIYRKRRTRLIVQPMCGRSGPPCRLKRLELFTKHAK
jgi:hypothetical protein